MSFRRGSHRGWVIATVSGSGGQQLQFHICRLTGMVGEFLGQGPGWMIETESIEPAVEDDERLAARISAEERLLDVHPGLRGPHRSLRRAKTALKRAVRSRRSTSIGFDEAGPGLPPEMNAS